MNEKLPLDAQIESLLFFKGEPLTPKEIAGLLGVSQSEAEEALLVLKENLKERGLQVIMHGQEIMLATHRTMGPFFEAMRKEELTKELSKASMETLSIILYKDGASRADIDYVRGVNSSFILRNLLIRGLIRKSTDPNDSRRNVYSPTLDLLAFMGVSRVEDLPDYESISKVLAGEASIENSQVSE